MQLVARCEGCGAEQTIFVGDPIDLPAGYRLHGAIGELHDRHRCPPPPVPETVDPY